MGTCYSVLVSMLSQMCEVSNSQINCSDNNSYVAQYKIRSLDYKPLVPVLSAVCSGSQHSCLLVPMFYWVVMWSLWVGTLFTLYLLHLGVFIFILVKISADCKICKAFTSRIGTYHFWNQSFFYRVVHYGFFNSSRWSFSAFVFCSNNPTGCGSGTHSITCIVKGYIVLGGGLALVGFDQPMYSNSSLIVESEENLEMHNL